MNSKNNDKKIGNFLKLSPRERHKKVLQVYYYLCKDNPLRHVLRMDVAKKLGFKYYKDERLEYEVIYLRDEGFLEIVEQFCEKVTSYGIDEVENGFPSFFERPKEKPHENGELFKKLKLLLDKINDDLDLAEKGLLKSSRLREDEGEITKGLEEIKKYFDEESQLKFEKLIRKTHWIREGLFSHKQDAKNILEPLHVYIEEILEKKYGKLPKNEIHISKGEHYVGREHFRKILRRANKEIFLVDNFLHPEILSVVKVYLDKIETIKFLTRKKDNGNFKSFSSDFKNFKKEFEIGYPNLYVEARYNNGCHDRYIIIDVSTVFHSGHSFNQLGNKISGINKISDERVKNKCLDELNNLWNKGVII